MAIALGSAAATLATPLGVELPRYAAMLLASPIRQSISEWEPTSAASGAFLLGALPLLLALTSFGARAPLRDRIVAGTFIVALFGAVRNVPVFAIAVTPIVLGAVPPRLPDPRAGLSRAVFVMSTAAALLLAILAWRASPSIDPMPTDQARALLATASAPRVFCEDFAWCSLFLGTPGKARVFLDGRCDPYPAAVWRDYRTVLDGNERWSTVLAAHRVDAVLVRRDGALDSLLAGRTAWRAIAADRHTRLYLRSPAQPANVRPS